ncbi:SIS domain-containing protein [Sphingomonas sp. ASV193]|uniref:SIS domain-containing protein n=1 Tax=Sphingomonas sp. ASV193 TaxID=3144405 RepID=UPI0032E86EBD
MTDAVTLAGPTLMARETAESPAVVERQLRANHAALREVGEQLRAAPPRYVATCARGTSDHVATYAKYLIETMAGVPVMSAAPSVASLYGKPLQADGAWVIAISQSGRSPDLLDTVGGLASGGARTIALVNDESSPLAESADIVLPLHAGPERAVAATKSCIASLAGVAALVAGWTGDEALGEALDALPAMLAGALALDWSPARVALVEATQMFVLGRGLGFGVAQEAALKLKETCGIQAEPFSSAEVRHGPMRIVEPGFPILGFAQGDSAGSDVVATAAEFGARGALVRLATKTGDLPVVAGHPALEPIAMLMSFYPMVEALSRDRGHDPDSPPSLAKVTCTR